MTAMSRPSEVPNAMASQVAASAVAERKLFASFIACARPGSEPTRNRRSLSPASTGWTCAHASSGPAYITASVLALAPATPPETGASTNATPSAESVCATSRAAWTPMVEVSITCVVRRSATERRPRTTCSDAAPSGRLRTTTSACCATSRVDPTNRAPSGERAEPSASWDTTLCPACTRFVQRTLPMLPRPTKPTVSMSASGRLGAFGPHGLDPAAGGDGRGGAAIGGDLEHHLVDLLVADAGARRTARVQAKLVHPAEGGRHCHHEQAPVTRAQRAAAGPYAPCHRGEVVLELRGSGVGVSGRPVDVGVAEHAPPHCSCCAEFLGLFHSPASDRRFDDDVHGGGAAVGHVRLSPHLNGERHVHQRVQEPQDVPGVVG